MTARGIHQLPSEQDTERKRAKASDHRGQKRRGAAERQQGSTSTSTQWTVTGAEVRIRLLHAADVVQRHVKEVIHRR